MTVIISAVLAQCPCLCPPVLDLSSQSSPVKLESQGDLSRDSKEKQDCSRWRRGHSRQRQPCGRHGSEQPAFTLESEAPGLCQTG